MLNLNINDGICKACVRVVTVESCKAVGAVACIAWLVTACGDGFKSSLFADAGAGGESWTSGSGGEPSAQSHSSAGGASVSSSTSSANGGAGSGGLGGDGGAGLGGMASSTRSSASSSGSGGDGGSPSGGGGSGGAEPCGPSNCAGCCAGDACKLGSSDDACGFGGEACDVCKDTCGWDPPNPPGGFCSTDGIADVACQAFACVVVNGWCCPGQCGNGACLP